MIPTDRWGDGVFRAARRLASSILDGVGIGESVELVKPVCVHIRRSLSPADMEFLTPEWLAIPARDEFSEDGRMEMDL